MKQIWLKNGFICKELYSPFFLNKDNEYYDCLKKKYSIVLKQAQEAGADKNCVDIIKKYKEKILESIRSYYKADLSRSYTIIRNLIKDIGNNSLAVDTIENSYAFPGRKGEELQLFRSRIGNPSRSYKAQDMLHLPRSKRALSGNYRFSIPGNPSMYFSNSSYGCWIETGFPAYNDFNVSPVVLDGSQVVFNMAISIRDFHALDDFDSERVYCWLKLYMLSLATSFCVKEENRIFKSEYIISQAIMSACRRCGYDGVAYYSKRVSDDVFSLCAINLALFVKYDKEYSEIVKHMKMDDSFNFALYGALGNAVKQNGYQLRAPRTGFVTNIGSYDRQYPYAETEFYNFDKFLFATWKSKVGNKGKDMIPWGIKIEDN